MLPVECDIALKEWAISCRALREGRQLLLLRKGGIREAGFQVKANAFLLLPTCEHQKAELLQPEWAAKLDCARPVDATITGFDTFALLDTILEARNEEQLRRAAHEHIWVPEFVRMRFNYHPYDPLYLLVLRVFRLQKPVMVPTQPSFAGCRSWITLDQPVAIEGAHPAISDTEFEARRQDLLEALSE